MPRSYPKLPFLILPLTRLEVPGWGVVFGALRIADSAGDTGRWREAPTRVIHGKWHGFRMRLRLSNWSERMTYFLGRFYDLPLQMTMSACLVPGDRFVDVGANIGMISLHACRLVGPSGRVDSVEPNPECYAAIRDHVALNAIENLRLHPVALSEAPGEALLTLITPHSGMGTLATVRGDDRTLVTGSFPVRTTTGDDLLGADPSPVKLIKIDVEGFELLALKGLAGAVASWRPAIVTELIDHQLRRAGTSRDEVAALLTGWGYSPYGMASGRAGLGRRLRLVGLPGGVVGAPFSDFLWLHAESAAAPALRPFLG